MPEGMDGGLFLNAGLLIILVISRKVTMDGRGRPSMTNRVTMTSMTPDPVKRGFAMAHQTANWGKAYLSAAGITGNVPS
jgi:hypothetical protein